jgi:hypothetical protein
MKLRKIVTSIMIASVFFWAPSMIPVKAGPAPCGSFGWTTADTAFAFPASPCFIPGPKAATPWGVIALGLSAVSVITSAIIVSRTQCRELTHQEAMSSILLPFIGIAMNKHSSKCRH